VSCLAFIGCSHQEFSTSYEDLPASAVADFIYSGEQPAEPATSPSQERMERLAQVLAEWQARSGPEYTDYCIGPGDELEINIFSLEVQGKMSTLTPSVSEDGFVSLPWAGSIQAGGLSAQQLEERIKTAYAGRYLKDPQVTVVVTEYRSAAIVVTGAVERPGVYYLTRNKSTVLAVLAQAGGLSREAGNELLITRTGQAPGDAPASEDNEAATAPDELTLAPETEQAVDETADFDSREVPARSGKKIIALDLKELIDKGNFALNVEVESGDILTISPRSPQYVYVLGYVQKPGAFEMKDGVRFDALQAVALAGGLSTVARAQNSFLVRETPEGQKVNRVDLTKIARGAQPPVYMQAGDTLVIGSSFFGRLSEFIKPSISAGATYAP
jgi:polysaccharide export outer membrane protein